MHITDLLIELSKLEATLIQILLMLNDDTTTRQQTNEEYTL
jgi:hypothetical protein